ncbi:MAG: BamA/TamA family outer membrane protein [Aquabacterium sp.]|nr:BamA/TamA family outer membrane protein [Aquabacterium sp.]
MRVRWLHAPALAACASALVCSAALAQASGAVPPAPTQEAPAAAAAAPSAAASAAQASPRPAAPRLEFDAPPALRQLLEQHLDIARLARLAPEDQADATEWARLVAVAPAQARELLQTEGYFEAEVVANREAGPPPLVRIVVRPGARTQVQQVTLTTEGALGQHLQAAERDARLLVQQVRQALPLRAGAPFRNADWAESKLQAQVRLRAAGYASARLTHSAADIDPSARSARLAITVDSGPLYRFGDLHVAGLVHHDEATVRHLAGIDTGAPLMESTLLDYQERLQGSGLFETAAVTFEPEIDRAEATAVQVRLRELPLQQATVGLGYSADTGPRASLEHLHRRLLGRAIASTQKLEWGRDTQRWSGDLTTHPLAGFHRYLLGAQVERVRSDVDVVLSQRLRLGRTTDTPAAERLVFVEWLRSRQAQADGGVADARAASANLHLVLRRLDHMLLPTKGYSLSLQLGGGQARSSGGRTGPYARTYARLTGYWPFGTQWYGAARLEAGGIVRPKGVEVPDALGFRAGGDDSVRGYPYRSLAPVVNGDTISGHVLLTGSVELARPLSAQLPSVWGAVFVDAGRAARRWTDYSAARGWGVGVRWRSPVGALRADLAWGQELRKARLHLSAGVTF